MFAIALLIVAVIAASAGLYQYMADNKKEQYNNVSPFDLQNDPELSSAPTRPAA